MAAGLPVDMVRSGTFCDRGTMAASPDSTLNILLIEDDPADFGLLKRHLGKEEFKLEMRRISSDAELDKALRDEWDAVLADFAVPGMDFRLTLKRIRARLPEVPVILVSGSIGEEATVSLLREGLTDIILKDRLVRLGPSIRRALAEVEDHRARRQAEAALRESRNRLEQAEEIAHMGSWAFEPGDNRLCWSDETYRIFGMPPQSVEVTEEIFLSLVHPDDRERVEVALSRSLREGADVYEIEHRIVRKDDGTIRCVHEKCRHYRDEGGRVVRSVGVVLDITERKEVEDTLRERELRYRGVIETSLDGFWLVNRSGRLLSVNNAYSRMSGYSEEELLNLSISDLEASETTEETTEHIAKLYDQGHDRFETTHRRKDGSLWPVEITVSLAPPLGDMFVFVRDLTEIKALEAERVLAEEHIRRLAFHDPLTHLPNRRLLTDRLKQALAVTRRNGRHGALLFIDLDNFKQLNDSLGHEMGDLLLVLAARRLTDCVRQEDTVARLGGDEFVVMLTGLSEYLEESESRATAVAEKILAALNWPYQLNQHVYQNTPSIGVTLFRDDQDVNAVFRRADSAMYHVKKTGRNALSFFRFQG
jgi:diguanylate cyclase (GGDEF)-like protein/PAS domain S-box-containing protein